jgi:hypothetical protein
VRILWWVLVAWIAGGCASVPDVLPHPPYPPHPTLICRQARIRADNQFEMAIVCQPAQAREQITPGLTPKP